LWPNTRAGAGTVCDMIRVTEKALYGIQYDKMHGGSLTERANLTKHMLMHTHESTHTYN
jgi:hypothetical protein